MNVASDNRKEHRQSSDGLARVRVIDGPFEELKNIWLDAEVRDVSASGLRLDCDELLDQCDLLVEISLNCTSDSVTLKTEVRWVTWEEGGRFQMGVEFTQNDVSAVIKWYDILKTMET